MIKICQQENTEYKCGSCKSNYDVKEISVSVSENHPGSFLYLCPDCRKQLSKMLLKNKK